VSQPKPDSKRGPVVVTLSILGKPCSQKNNKQIIPGKGKRRAMLVDSARVAKWKKDALPQLLGQWAGRPPIITKGLGVIVTAYLGKKQRGDTDNLAAAPLDALQKAEVIDNDSQFSDVVVMRRKDDDNPRIELLIFPARNLDVRIVGHA
jgi:Holliday junction resolvase RusA-like endonuclease